MRTIILIFTLQIVLNATFFDQYNLFQAQVEYKNNNYKSSLEFYKKIENKTNEIHYNIGNIFYKQKRYKKAIESYKKINSINLNHKKLHNIANCYIAINKVDLAIAFYKSALKFKVDTDTKYNLSLSLDIQKKIIELKEEEEKKKREEDESLARVGKNVIDQFEHSNKATKIKSAKEKEDIKIKSNNISNLKSKNVVQEIKNTKLFDINGTKEDSQSKPNLSNLEEDKWNKTLADKTINTLLIPLENKGIKNAQYPW